MTQSQSSNDSSRPWDPGPDFQPSVQQIIERARVDTVRRWRRAVGDELERLSARGLGGSGAALGVKNRAEVECLREFGTEIGRELTALVTAVYGSVPAEAVSWILD